MVNHQAGGIGIYAIYIIPPMDGILCMCSDCNDCARVNPPARTRIRDT